MYCYILHMMIKTQTAIISFLSWLGIDFPSDNLLKSTHLRLLKIRRRKHFVMRGHLKRVPCIEETSLILFVLFWVRVNYSCFSFVMNYLSSTGTATNIILQSVEKYACSKTSLLGSFWIFLLLIFNQPDSVNFSWLYSQAFGKKISSIFCKVLIMHSVLGLIIIIHIMKIMKGGKWVSKEMGESCLVKRNLLVILHKFTNKCKVTSKAACKYKSTRGEQIKYQF